MFKKEDYLYEAQRAITKNWVLLISIFLVILIWQVYSIHSQNLKITKMEQAIENDLQSVIALTDGGVVVEVQKQSLVADNEATLVARALRNLVVSRSELTNGFTISEFATPSDILKNTEQLQDFTEYLLLPDETNEVKETIKTIDGKLEEKTAKELSDQGVGYFTAYLEALKQFIQSDTLPHFATVYKTEVKEYQPDNNKFTISVIYYVTLQNWEGKDKDGKDLYTTTNSRYEVKAKGYFNIKLRTKQATENVRGLNKLGLHFFEIKVAVPSKK